MILRAVARHRKRFLKFNEMKTLVTGGSGYLGTFVRNFFGAEDFSRRSGFDVRDEQAVERIANYDIVIHLAAHFDKSPDGASECFRTNATGTANILRNMKPGAIFIYASTKQPAPPTPVKRRLSGPS